VANSQFGPHRHENNSDSDHNEDNLQNDDNLQREQQEVHHPLLVDGDESGHRFRLAAEQSENECSQITHNNDRSEERSIPRAAVP
jgi:hypothetical protein